MKIITVLKAQAGKIKENITELYTFALVVIGLPAIAFVYLDWRAALVVFVVPQIILGFISLRGGK